MRQGKAFQSIAAPRAQPAKDDEEAATAKAKTERASEIWRACADLSGTAGAEYLRARCCDLPPRDGDLRFHPALWCSEVQAKLPALVARVSTVIGNRGVGVHRVWFRQGESRAVKKMRLGGSADPVCVRLWPDDAVTMGLGLAEGIETALSAQFLFKPIWATVDAGQMTKFPILRGVESLTIFADFDNAGIKPPEPCTRAIGTRASM